MVIYGGRLCRCLVFYHAFPLGWFWGGVGGMLTFLARARMVDATPMLGLGWGGMLTILARAHMGDATQSHACDLVTVRVRGVYFVGSP